MQLQSELHNYQQAGIGVLALTYDSPELQQAFVRHYGITYPLASDIAATSMRQLGVLNADYKPGDDSYGIPYPGVFVVSRDGRIAGKVFLKGYSTRVHAAGVLAYARTVLNR